MKLLHIDSSVLADNSVSRKLTAQIVNEWKANHEGTTVDYLDLASAAPSHLSADSLGFRLGADANLSDVQKHENTISEALVTHIERNSKNLVFVFDLNGNGTTAAVFCFFSF